MIHPSQVMTAAYSSTVVLNHTFLRQGGGREGAELRGGELLDAPGHTYIHTFHVICPGSEISLRLMGMVRLHHTGMKSEFHF